MQTEQYVLVALYKAPNQAPECTASVFEVAKLLQPAFEMKEEPRIS